MRCRREYSTDEIRLSNHPRPPCTLTTIPWATSWFGERLRAPSAEMIASLYLPLRGREFEHVLQSVVQED